VLLGTFGRSRKEKDRMIPLEATKEYAQGRFRVWPEDADADGVLRETARALDNVVSVWCDVRTAYRRLMLDLTQTPFGRARAAAKYIDSKTEKALSQLDTAKDSVKRELSELEKKHAPKLGNVPETMMEVEVRSYLRSLPEYQLVGALAEAAMVGDIAALRAILLAIPESVRETVAEGFARATDPEGFNRRGLLAKALAAIEKSGQALIVETSKLIPSQIRKADAHDVNAANRAERLTDLERVLAQAESGDGPVIYPGKGPGLYSAPLPDLPSLRPAVRTPEFEPLEVRGGEK
jgi:hypothetical protein